MKNKICSYLFILITILFLECKESTIDENTNNRAEKNVRVEAIEKPPIIEDKGTERLPGDIEQRLINSGLYNIKESDSTILVELKYSTNDNFSGIDLYDDLESCYLQFEVAEMLIRAQQFIKKEHPTYSLLVYDCARPRVVQQKLWDTLDMPPNQKKSFVADPKLGSIHNYGSAVDLTLADGNGNPLDMGTPYDHFGVLAYPTKEDEMLRVGKLTEEQVGNRKILRKAMLRAGFTPIKYEWWHFNALSRKKAEQVYKIIE